MPNFKFEKVNEVNIFYRSNQNQSKPNMLLLRGFPSASHMFRDLFPELTANFNLVAPDYLEFGVSVAQDRQSFDYTFDHPADLVEQLIIQLHLAPILHVRL